MASAGLPRYAAATVMALGLLAGPATSTAAAQTGPDLDAGTIDGPVSVQAGQRVHFETCVENRGDQDAGAFNIAWYVSGERLGYGRHLGVPAHTKVCAYHGGADGNSFFDWTAPNDPGGYRTIKWVVDADHQVPGGLFISS
jgi:hypothetical protein